MSESSSARFSRCRDCGILWPGSKTVPQHSHDLSGNRRENKTLRKDSWKRLVTANDDSGFILFFLKPLHRKEAEV